jgi:lipid-binding SYLF domain-containing protein
MKTKLFVLILLGFVGTALGLERAGLDRRIYKLTSKFEMMQQNTLSRIPPEFLRKANGVILLDRTKAGLIFAYEGGGGVAMAKDPKTKKWSPAAFVTANEASLGFQIGGQQSFLVILLMSTNASRLLTEPGFEFGGEARGTAGKASAGAESTISSIDAPVVVFDFRKGLYGGAAIKGGTLAPDEDANYAYYGQFLTMQEILYAKKVKPTESTAQLAETLTKYATQTASK